MNKEKKDKKIIEMKAKNAFDGIERNIGDVSNKIDLVMAAKSK
jgi:hypothetical protein